MSESSIPNDKREFRCNHCNGKIMIPRELPPTTGPCPHCGGIITSPPLYADLPPAPAFSAPAMPEPTPVRPAPLPTPMPSPVSAPISPPEPIPMPVASSIATPVSLVPEAPPTQPLEETVVPIAPEPSVAPVRQRAPEPNPVDEPPPVPMRAQGSLGPPQEPRTSSGKNVKLNSKNSERKSVAITLITILLLFIALGAGAVYFVMKAQREATLPKPLIPTVPPKTTTDLGEAQYQRIGWQKDARDTLTKFINAETAEAKVPYILNGANLTEKLDAFYGGTRINDSDTPAETFSVVELASEDKSRGIFMMAYDQPPQFNMKSFFRPLAPLEVQYGLQEADLLLSTVALVTNFAMEPLRVHAFFKRGPDGLKLDWETFIQTKYRTFENFVSLPEPGLKEVFRIVISEDVPDQGRGEQGTRTYRLNDPANKADMARVTIKVDSDIGRVLSPINWRGSQDGKPIQKTATVELAWTGDAANPQLVLNRFICWEFLGLGGDAAATTAASR